jgi:hypothetical protein
MLKTIIAAGLAISAIASAETPAPSIAGVWSIGDSANCASGNAWVMHKDGYYAEVGLPDKGPKAVGMWKDEGATIAYTHSHMPFADMTTGAPPRKFTVDARTPDKLTLKTFRGTPLIMHRCPADAVKAPAGQAEH